MSQFYQRLSADLQRHRLLAPRQKILVAVSGGVDSMVLLHGLSALAAESGWQLVVAHFNHQLRGRASAADEKLVRATAAKLGWPFQAGRANVKALAAREKVSIEMAARTLRHEFLAHTARANKVSAVALAHHADDQVELFFLRLLRGAGGEGLAGMKRMSPSPVDKKLRLIRPLLGFTKAELLTFAEEQGVRFREDASNCSPDHLRNRVRGELLPLLATNYQPGISRTVLRLMEIVGAESELAATTAREWLVKPVIDFKKLAVAVQRQAVNQQLLARGVVADFELVERLRESGGNFISVGQNLTVACLAGKLVWRTVSATDFNPAKLTVSLAECAARFGGREFCWSQTPVRLGFARPKPRTGLSAGVFKEVFDAETVTGPITLRHWRAGDRFQPIGLPKPVKLQDLFGNAKIPLAQRRALVVAATAAGEVFWVEGLRIGEKFKLTQETKVKLSWECSVLPV